MSLLVPSRTGLRSAVLVARCVGLGAGVPGGFGYVHCRAEVGELEEARLAEFGTRDSGYLPRGARAEGVRASANLPVTTR